MKIRDLSLALFATIGACAAPTSDDGTAPSEPTGESSDALKRPLPDPGSPPIIIQPDYCQGASATIAVSASSIALGATMTLQWSMSVPAGCTSPIRVGGEPAASSGTRVVKPLSNSTYLVQLGYQTLAYASVNVTLPGTVHIKGNGDEWKGLLVQAVGTPRTRVVLDGGVDMDLTGYESIYVREGVTLTSEIPAVSGTFLARTIPGTIVPPETPPPLLGRNARILGPRLYTTSRPKPLFQIECNSDQTIWGDNVRFAGFRLQGPHFETEDGDDNLERGIMITSCVGVEISTMELSGFSGASVYISDPLLRQVGPSAVSIHDNYIHNNQHVGGNGYGVDVGAGAWASIERNVFDFNRHAITASGQRGTSYVADRNLVLKGGGVHDKWYSHYTHLFDVHGDANCDYLPGDWAEHIWNCGNAGDVFVMTNNAFQFTNDYAIKLRGVPRKSATFSGNVFAHDSVGDAIETYDGTNIHMGPNTADVDPFGHYGVCDFDADGVDDLFLATGASWWFASGGKMHWTYLNSHTERLHQVGLGDFDGDKRCDVLAVNASTGGFEISKSGTSPWAALPYAAPFDQLRFGDFNGDKITDVFRRAPDGQWYAVSPGHWGWTALQSSSIPLADLRFGDFDGDGVTDVLKRNGAGYQVSLGAASPWQQWSSLSEDPEQLLIADIDASPGDDILRYVATSPIAGRWEISSGGRTSFQTFATLGWPNTQVMTTLAPARSVRSLVGRFDVWNKADLLALDFTRRSQIFSAGSAAFAAHGRYAY
jgi:hypothetical protein